MRKFYLLCTLLLVLSTASKVKGQDFSNKGKEFWLCFPSHVPSSGLANLVLFITSDKNSSGTVSVNGFNTTFTVTANQISSPINIPYANAYISDAQSGIVVNRGIRVKVDDGKPAVVVFAHIYAGFRSEASLILPVTTLGRKYYSSNFWQSSTNNSKSQFQIVATKPNTVVQYQLRRNGVLDPVVSTQTLANPGDVLQIQDNADLSGSVIESIATATASCNKIAVFSGSSALAIGSNRCTGNSYDPLFQQCYPVTSWGNNFGVVPLANNSNGFHVRVTASEDGTSVNFNGTNVKLDAGEYYPATSPSPQSFTEPLTISADKPISVSQYLMSGNCAGSNSVPGASNDQGDPDMIILNPVEQSIRDINIFSSNLQNIRTKFLCVYMKSSVASTFRINNAAPMGNFVPMPQNNGYSYLVEDLTTYGTQSFRLTADSGFNAITYGMGDAESYGYSAGTNVTDRYQFLSVTNEYASVNIPAACRNTPFRLSMTFPYQPSEIIWKFNGLLPDITLSSPTHNGTEVVDGKTLYRYDLPNPFLVSTAGSYPITVLAQNPTSDGCNGEQEIELELEIYEAPVANFNFTSNGCVSSPVDFTDASVNNSGRTIDRWHWNFGDGNTEDGVTSVSHNYTGPGTYNVKYTVITDVGCKADTVIKAVVLNDPPVAQFTTAAPYCVGKEITFTDQSPANPASPIVKWTWDFGDGSPLVTSTTNANQTHTYANTGTYTATLVVEAASGCLSLVASMPVTIHPNPVVDFSLPSVCLPAGAAQFNDLSTISDGTANQFTYAWNFGDGSAVSTIKDPLHNYAGVGPFNVELAVTSGNGCISTLTKALTTVYAEPMALFNSPAEVCAGSTINFTDQSTAAGSTVTGWEWDFGDGTQSTDRNPAKTFTVPGTYTVTLNVTTALGCRTVSTTNIATHIVTVNPLPVADFTLSLPGCAGQGVTFTDASVPNAGTITKWNWSYGDASTTVATTGSPVIHSYQQTGNYTATLQVETDKGCLSTLVSQDILVNPVPVAAFTPPNICVNDANTPFLESSTISAGSVIGWEWNFGDPNATGGNPNTSTLQQPSHHYTQPGNYDVQLIATSDAGCRDTLQQSFQVNGGVLTPRFTVENNTTLCSNQEIVIRDASQVDAGSIIRVEILWDENDPSTRVVDNDPQPGKFYTHRYPEFGSPASRTYRVQYAIYSGATCVNTITQDITLLATPQLALDAVAPVCDNAAPFQLVVQLQNGLPGSGVFSGAGVSSSGMFDPSLAGPGMKSIVYTYTGTNGCSNTITKVVEVNPTPIADAGPDKVVLEGGKVKLTPTLITGIPVTYTWTPPTWLDNPAIAQPESSPLTDFNYRLTVTSDKGCTTFDDVAVTLLRAPVIPNIFSPNGDGINDRWVIEYLDTYPGCIVQIFNRYGQRIHQFVNYTTPWDGKINGKDAPIGTYYYIIDPKNGRKPMTGYVDIIR